VRSPAGPDRARPQYAFWLSAAEALKKWDGGLEPRGKGLGSSLPPQLCWSAGCHLGKCLKIQVQICAIWCIVGGQCSRKCTTQCSVLILGDQVDDIRSSKVARKIDEFTVSAV